ncbi:ParM/StbA family protein [Pseudomonas sp. GOM6]|uniref:ParM/StbA family protein n=1 Tax=Pseudomonas sp. GOM6 TaxID=3036944 RepID=UPI00240A7AE4|nr:ParM/StbA family protein [Pseudomonas sp. GOM6]MDG1580940.1 ParM/StbA family protein [Pseudomonas sp. GOM6]
MSSKAPKNATGPFVVGLDIGYSNVKIAFGYPSQGEPKTLVRPAHAAPISAVNGEHTAGPGEFFVTVKDERWLSLISPARADIKRELHANYPSTDLYYALFLGALVAATEDGQSVIDNLITGLPTSQSRDPALIEALTKRLKGKHQVAPSVVVEVKEVLVVPQPAGILNDIYSSYSDPELLDESHILVVDPGFYSVDWVNYNKGHVVKDASGTALEAMSAMIGEINRQIGLEHAVSPGVEKIEMSLQAGRDNVVVRGARVPLAPYVERAQEIIANEALKDTLQSMRFQHESQPLDFIFLGGGGSEYYKAAVMRHYPDAQVLTSANPVVSNAVGFWLYGNV